LIPFTAFLLGLVGALTAKFQWSSRSEREGAVFGFVLVLSLLVSGIGLGSLFRALKVKDRGRGFVFVLGFLLVPPLFFGIDRIESILSRDYLLLRSQPSDFRSLAGHCGVRAGRAVLRLYDQQFRSPVVAALGELELGSRCRIGHYRLLEKEGRISCASEETPIDCRTRWMMAFSEQGFWDFETRSFFHEKVFSDWEESKKEESLLAYALKDQEIEARRTNLLRQAGMDDSPSAWAVRLQQKDELRHLELTIRIFEAVNEATKDLKGPPSPQLLKFRDLLTEIEQKRQKIAEIKKSIEDIER
jgi:hypothetical protein